MQKLASLALTVLLVCTTATVGFSGEPEGAEEKDAPKPEVPVDILKDVLAMNGEGAVKPPTQFRKGHVKARTLAAEALAKTETGFSIQLPSRAPVPTPTVSKGRLFVSGGFHSKEFYAFDAKTGAFLWGIDIDDDGPSSAVVEDDVVVFNTESCTVFAVDAQSGKQLWSLWLGDPLMSTPAVYQGVVYTAYPAAGRAHAQQQLKGAPDEAQQPGEIETPVQPGNAPASHVFCALDLKTGKILWQKWIDSDVMTAPVISGGNVYASTFAGTLYEFAPKSGDIPAAKRYRATSAPIVVGGDIFVTRRADVQGDGVVLESLSRMTKSGTIQFDANKKEAKYLDSRVQREAAYAEEAGESDASNGFGGGAPAAANGAAGAGNIGQSNVASFQAFQGSRGLRFRDWNFNTMGDELVCTDPATGDTTWSLKIAGDLEKSGGFLATSPAVAGDSLFVATLDGRVLRIDPAKGDVKQTWKVGSPIRFQPAVHDGRIYVGTQDGRVVMVNTGHPKYTGWTAWGGNSQHTGVVEVMTKTVAPK